MIFSGFAKLSRVYGWSEHQVMKLTFSKFIAYLKQAEVLITEERMFALQVADWPRIEPHTKRRILTCYEQIVNPSYEQERQQKNSVIFERMEKQRRKGKQEHNAKKGKR